ncbi:glycosyltransferase [bacterium]|nr:MAG: glycosyltransferase [bacterium]
MVCENGKKASPSILVLIAALNEEDGIGLTLAELRQFLSGSQFLVVDGNSIDRTVHIAKSLGADVIYQKGKGKGDAIGYALVHIDDNFDYVVFTDADYTYPAEYIPQMIRIIEEKPQVGMVCGNRFNAHLHLGTMRDVFYFGNRVIALTHNLLNGVELRDPLTGLRVIRGELIKNWQPKSAGFDIEVELNHHIERQGYSITEIDIPYRERIGEKKLKLKDSITILKRIITESTY